MRLEHQEPVEAHPTNEIVSGVRVGNLFLGAGIARHHFVIGLIIARPIWAFHFGPLMICVGVLS